jgi:radical SAM protein with 4Fe4S-binding SPASM domain
MNIAHTSSHYYGNEDNGVRDPDTEAVLEQVEHYRALRGMPRGPVGFLESLYLKNIRRYLRTGITPQPCHALRSSCFVNSWGDVYPCGMYDAKIASLRDHEYDLARIWNLPRTKELQQEIWGGKCPQCWTPCEAYQTILGNMFRSRKPFAAPVKVMPPKPRTDLIPLELTGNDHPNGATHEYAAAITND